MKVKEILINIVDLLETINSETKNSPSYGENSAIKGISHGSSPGIINKVTITGTVERAIGMQGKIIVQPCIPTEIISKLRNLLILDLKEKSIFNKSIEIFKTLGPIGISLIKLIRTY